MNNFLPRIQTISLVLKQPVPIPVEGLPDSLSIKEGVKLTRTCEELEASDQTPLYDINWKLINQDKLLHDLPAGILEGLYQSHNKDEIFEEYEPVFVDVPELTTIQKLIHGNNETYNLRLSFKTEAEANELANHIEAIYKNKMSIFRNDNDTIPTILEVCKLIACCSSEMEELAEQVENLEVPTVTNQLAIEPEPIIAEQPKTDQFDGPMIDIASHNQQHNNDEILTQ